MPRFAMATLNHSPLHGLGTQLAAHLDAAVNAGFDGLAPDVFWLRALVEEGVELERVAEDLASRGLACTEIAGLAIGGEEETRAELEENLRYARALDAEFVNTRIVSPPDAALLERLRVCAEELAGVGTRIALEFSRGTQLKDLAGTLAFMAEADAPGVGATLDTWHYFLNPEGPDWGTLESLDSKLLANVQLSDGAPYPEGGFGQATMNARRLPGEGEFDLGRCARTLAERGFDGPIIIEVLNEGWRNKPVSEFATEAARTSRQEWRSE